MTLIIAILSSFFAVYAGAVTINAPKKMLIPAGFGGVVCWVLYVIASQQTNSPILSTFLSSLGVAVYSQIMARTYKTPVTIFFIPGFLPIVPGLTIYRSAFYYISGNSEKFYHYLSETLQTATVIALAIAIVDALFKLMVRLIKK